MIISSRFTWRYLAQTGAGLIQETSQRRRRRGIELGGRNSWSTRARALAWADSSRHQAAP